MKKIHFIIFCYCISSPIEANNNVVQLPTIVVKATPSFIPPERFTPPVQVYLTSNDSAYASIVARGLPNEEGQDDCTPNPIRISSGEKIQEANAFTTSWEMPLNYSEYYSSLDKSMESLFSAPGLSNYRAYLGRFSGWRSNFTYEIYPYQLVISNNFLLKVRRVAPDGSEIFKTPSGKIGQNIGISNAPKEITLNDSTITLDDGGKETYSSVGLISKQNIHGVGWKLEYNGNKLSKITHTNGKSIQINWKDASIKEVKDPAGNIYTYKYNSNNFLVELIYPDNLGKITYHYGENGADEKKLTGISINDKRYSNYLYNNGKAIQSGRSDGSETYNLELGDNYTTLTNPLGAVLKYIYTDNNKTKLSKIERSGVNYCPNSSVSTSYDNNGYVSSKIDWNGITTEYTRDANGKVTQQITGIKGTDRSQIMTTKYLWDPNFAQLNKIERYSGNSNQLIDESIYEYYPETHIAKNRIKSLKTCTTKEGKATCDVVGYGYTFHNNSMVKNIAVNKNGKTTTYTNDDIGNLTEIKNALGHVISYSNYNGLGQVGKITDANGLITELTYDARGRIITEKQTLASDQTRTSTYQYGAFGVTQTERNGIRETINYNDNGTIANITHGVGNQVTSSQDLTYSKLGQLLTVTYKEGSNIRFSQSSTHNQLGWTTASLGNNGQNILYSYDANGNIIQKTDSLNKVSKYQYDVQNRLIGETDPVGGVTQYSYDKMGNLNSVIDPQGKKTSMTYDDLGHLIKKDSPDTGISQYEYDVDGNLTKITRADNSVTTYSYDALNRIIQAQTGKQTQAWVYDTCTNGKGRICGTSNGITSKGYSYTKDGQLSVQITKIDGVSYPIYWTYDDYGRLTGESRVGTGDDSKVTYQYDALSRINSVKVKIGGKEQTIVSNVQYEPYGRVKSWTYGNGLEKSRAFDRDYRLTAINTPTIQNLVYSYNNNNLLTKMTNSLETNKTTSYSYDDLGQLTKAASTLYSESWTLDKNSNRLTRTGNTNALTNYKILVGNQLANTTTTDAKAFSYDLLGNLTKKTGFGGTVDYTYDGFNRLKTVKLGSITTTYEYDVNNLRSRKSNSAGSINYIYAPDGRLLAESELSAIQKGSLGTIYIWLDGQVIGMVRSNKVYYVHTDHLGRPESITNSDKAVVWKAQTTSYDSTMVKSSIGEFNIGFPGQYYDSESGLWYNRNRYYDPSVGRYTQSDPIGLAGGLNTYAYARSNPVNFIDPYGLWSLSAEGYYGVGGGGTISYKNGKLEVLGRFGVGLGVGVGLDPNGAPSKHSLDCGSGFIARTNSKLEMSAGIGPIEATAFGVSGFTGNGLVQAEKGGDLQVNKPQLVIPGITVDPSKKFSWKIGGSIGGNVSAEFGHYSNW